MCEQSDEPKDGYDLELQLLGLVRHALGQGVQPQEKNANAQDNGDQKQPHDNHERIGLAGTVTNIGSACGAAGLIDEAMLFPMECTLKLLRTAEPDDSYPRGVHSN